MSAARLKALCSLEKLQDLEADEARAHLARCVQEEELIEAAIDRIEKDIASNKRFAFEEESDENRKLDLQRSYREWLPLARRQIEEKNDALQDAHRHTEMAREAMVKINTALEATGKLIKEIKAEREMERQHREQADIDDIARTTFIRRHGGQTFF